MNVAELGQVVVDRWVEFVILAALAFQVLILIRVERRRRPQFKAVLETPPPIVLLAEHAPQEGGEAPEAGREPPGSRAREIEDGVTDPAIVDRWSRDELERAFQVLEHDAAELLDENEDLQARVTLLEDALEQHRAECGYELELGREVERS